MLAKVGHDSIHLLSSLAFRAAVYRLDKQVFVHEPSVLGASGGHNRRMRDKSHKRG